MLKKLLLYSFWSSLGFFVPAMCVISQETPSLSQIQKHEKELNKNEHLIQYTYGSITIAEGKLQNRLKTHKWVYYYKSGAIKSESNFLNDSIHGESNSYFENGDLLCNVHYHHGKPTKIWKSYYQNSRPQGEITWNENHLPNKINLYFKNGLPAFEKTFSYLDSVTTLHIKSYFKTGVLFEEYSLEFSANEFTSLNMKELNSIMFDLTPNMLFKSYGSMNGFYKRNYANGKTAISCEFYDGKLLELFEQNSPTGTPVTSWNSKGNGTLIQFHNSIDTAAILHYENGLKTGKAKFFHTKNNTYKTGYFKNGIPTKEWFLYSFSGKTRQKYSVNDSLAKWEFYGARSKKAQSFSLIDKKLQGRAFKFNFYGDTVDFKKYQSGAPLRSGEYFYGEQIGIWNTHGQFNPVTHSTYFLDKTVIYNSECLPELEFSFTPKFEFIPTYAFVSRACESYDLEITVYEENLFSQILLSTPDSDDIYGTTWLKTRVSEMGSINSILLIKSPSIKHFDSSVDLLLASSLFSPKIACGFPVSSEIYIILDHY